MFMSALLTSGNKADNLSHGALGHLFTELEQPAYAWVNQFSKNYGDLPTVDTFEDATKVELPIAPEPVAYYLDLLRQRYTHDSLLAGMESARKILGDTHDQEKALAGLTDLVMQLVAEKHGGVLRDFREAYDLVMSSYLAKKSGAEAGIKFGWPTLDKMTGGMVTGDVVSLIGKPAAGKSWQLCYNAYHAWSEQDKVPLIVSTEMAMLAITQRLASLHAKKNFGQIKDGTLTSVGEKQVSDRLGTLAGAPVPLWVLDGNLSSSVEDIYAIARQVKPDCIYIDGAYLLTHPKEHDRYKRVAENTSLIKKELASLCPVVCSWQFSREAAKKKKIEEVGLDEIGYSNAIGEISSIALGLFQEESVETVKGRVVNILKGRNGETGRFTTNWNFSLMDFSERVEVAFEKIQYP
jgi:replicative DNA helicase